MLPQPTPATFARPNEVVLTSNASTLHVCTMVSNATRFASRYRLTEAFNAQNDGPHIEHWTVEIAYGNRPFVVTERGNPNHLQLRSSQEMWLKENALNLLFAHVLRQRPDAEYFAWVDADVTFARADWAYETLQQLQHYDVVQMFTHAEDVDIKFTPLGKKSEGFIYAYYNDPQFLYTRKRFGYYQGGHPGYAWAARRRAIDTFGGLYDTAIVGGGDRHMACGLIGTIELSVPSEAAQIDDLAPNFKRSLLKWQEHALELHKNVGYVDGLLLHHWHGKKVDRQYGSRWRIYIDNQFDQWMDLRRDTQGLYQLDSDRVKLRDDLRSYLRSRNEDSIGD